MYIVLQYGSMWGIFDRDAGIVRKLEQDEVSSLTAQFANLLGKGILNVFQCQKINPSKLMKMPATGYVIVRVGTVWTIYEAGKPTPRILEEQVIEALSLIFPTISDQQMLNAIAIDTLNPTKLLNVTPKVAKVGPNSDSNAKHATSGKEIPINQPMKNTG